LQTFGFSLIIVRRKPADPSAVPAAEGFSNGAVPMTWQVTCKVPWNLSVIVKSSTGQFADISIAAGCDAIADRSDGVMKRGEVK
jgi:hypothetical protein